MLGDAQVRGTRVHLNFALEDYGKGEGDGRFNVIKKFIESYTSAQPAWRNRSDSDSSSCAKEAVDDRTNRNKENNHLMERHDASLLPAFARPGVRIEQSL